MKFIALFLFAFLFASCADKDHFDQLPDRQGPDVGHGDTHNPQITYCEQGGWWCANGGICVGRECQSVQEDETIGIRCNRQVELTFWGNRFPHDQLGEPFNVSANQLVTGTTDTTAITVVCTDTSLVCECFDGGHQVGSGHTLPTGGWGCSQ